MRLALISPSIIRKIIAGDYPPGLTINRARKSLPLIWTEQEKILLKQKHIEMPSVERLTVFLCFLFALSGKSPYRFFESIL